eukprot:TRINITY_DN64171_c0_g1_i1.p1 TRINITY_DN64171_c0_g1~~TRINITY_DN64171_c0_g1_i1.p1  ORF type:complete len:772 (+),score=93.08 TRINITY_DN64171_c0_g1_i1:97-2412(+)
MSDDDYEFEGDSDEDDDMGAGSNQRCSNTSMDAAYPAIIQEWSRQHPEADVRLLRDESDESCIVIDLNGIRLQVYVPVEEGSTFFVTTENESASLSSILTTLNDASDLTTLPLLLTRACTMLPRSKERCMDSLPWCWTGALRYEPRDVRASSVALCFESVKNLVEDLISRVSSTVGVDESCAALLLSHVNWDVNVLVQRLEADRGTLFVEAGIAPSAEDYSRAPPTAQVCCVCFVDDAIDCLPCGHGLCSDDWHAFLKCNLESGTVGGDNCVRLKCPGERCPVLVPPARFHRFLEAADYARYERLRVISFVNDCRDTAWCPADGCELCVAFSRRRSTERCGCGHSFCFSCKLDAHAPAKCSSAKLWQTKSEQMKGVAGYAVVDAKVCPNPECGAPSRKEDGCNYLVCPRCRVSWCWQCGDWGGGPSGRPEPHHVYDCNNPTNQEWAKSTAENFRDDGRDRFYYERYLNHLQSREFADKLRASLPRAGCEDLTYTICNPSELCRTYSSVLHYDAVGTGACRSMLESPQCWSPDGETEEWMQIDLGSVQSVAGVILQGNGTLDASEWVTRFRIEHGLHAQPLTPLAGDFRGCFDATSRVKALFQLPVPARFIRVVPLQYHGQVALRAAVLVASTDGDAGWICQGCASANRSERLACFMCDQERPASAQYVDASRRDELHRLLRDAADLLIECRRVLAWSYVWAFYQEDEAQRRLFEFVQKDLETKTEHLSGMLEKRTTAGVLKERDRLLDFVAALGGYLENISTYTVIDPDLK